MCSFLPKIGMLYHSSAKTETKHKIIIFFYKSNKIKSKSKKPKQTNKTIQKQKWGRTKLKKE